MKCKKCNRDMPDDGVYCPYCGIRQVPKPPGRKKRGNGQGTVYKYKNGWRALITLGYTSDGKRKTKSKVFEKKSDAINALAILRSESQTVLQQKNPTFEECFNLMMRRHVRRVGSSTEDSYNYAFKHFASISFLKITEIKTEHLQECVDRVQGKSMASKMKATASLIFKFAIANDLVSQNYAEYIVLPKQEEQEREHFSIEEIQKILLAVDKVPYADYIAVLILTGMRPNEMFWLRQEDYHGTYFIGGSKTEAGKNRLIPIPTIIQPMVKNIAGGHSDFIFCAPNGKKMDLTNFRKRCYYPALKTIGVRPLAPYSCRHTFATLLKNSNAPITDKQKLMGHSSFSMTAHYTHTDVESLQKASDSATTLLQPNIQKIQ